MKIAVIGGAEAMVRTIIRDLSECPKVEEILTADYQGKNKRIRSLFPRFSDEG